MNPKLRRGGRPLLINPIVVTAPEHLTAQLVAAASEAERADIRATRRAELRAASLSVIAVMLMDEALDAEAEQAASDGAAPL